MLAAVSVDPLGLDDQMQIFQLSNMAGDRGYTRGAPSSEFGHAKTIVHTDVEKCHR